VTHEEHLSAERVADLLDGSLPSEIAIAAHSHVATCRACRQLRDDQAFVASLLADEGRRQVEMPQDVAVALEAALRRAADERAAGVTSLSEARRRKNRGPVRWLAAAAAAIAIAGLGVAGWQLVDHGTTTTASQHPTPGNGQGGPSTASLNKGIGNAPPKGWARNFQGVYPATAARLPAEARYFANHPRIGIAPTGLGCARPHGAGPSMVVKWQGKQQILVLDRKTKTAKILDCQTAQRMLHTTRY
jgi:hypothetical protein